MTDRTDLTGEYDFKLDFAKNDDPATGPSILTAVREQLGLRIDAVKGAMSVLVIDGAEKPSAN